MGALGALPINSSALQLGRQLRPLQVSGGRARGVLASGALHWLVLNGRTWAGARRGPVPVAPGAPPLLPVLPPQGRHGRPWASRPAEVRGCRRLGWGAVGPDRQPQPHDDSGRT